MAIIDNLLAYWNLDESSGNAADATGNGYTLTNTNVTYSGGGADFDAATDKLETTNTVFDFQPTNAFSVSLWVDLVSIGSNQFLICNQNNGGDFQGWSLYQQSSGAVRFDMFQDLSPLQAIQTTTPSSAISTTLVHILMTKSTSAAASSVKVYVNGTSQTMTVGLDSLAGTITYASDLRLGNRGDGFNLDGKLRNVGLWDIELTSTDATFLYNAGTPLAYADLLSTPASGFFHFF